jgi:predicted DNA-binding transcriptional regulator AlpA
MVAGTYPRSVELGDKSRGWWSDELDEYYASLPRTRLKGDEAA